VRHAPLCPVTPPRTTEISTLSLHDALPIYLQGLARCPRPMCAWMYPYGDRMIFALGCSKLDPGRLGPLRWPEPVHWKYVEAAPADRKSTRLNSSHLGIPYAVFCLKTKNVSD